MTQREWADKDYYADLDVPKSASPDKIKKAYRKLAWENRSDKNPDNKATEDKFRRISEAYSVVGDEDKRRRYDGPCAALVGNFRFPGAADAGGAGVTGARGFDFDMSGLFGEGVGFGGNTGGAGGLGDFLGGFVDHNGGAGVARRRKARRGVGVETEITLDLREAIQGITIPPQLTNPSPCTNCDGSGVTSGTLPVTCTTCRGPGYAREQKRTFGLSSPYADRGGQGTRVENPCSQCNGTGMTTRHRTVAVCVPAGVVGGQKAHLASQDRAGLWGRSAGDLFIAVRVCPGEVFARSGNGLEATVPVSFGEPAFGGTTTVPMLGNKIRVRVPTGIINDRILRVRGRGIPKHNGTPGDLLVTAHVKVPTNLDDNTTSALRSYVEAERASGFDPREGQTGVK